MDYNNLLNSSGEWLNAKGPESDIIISSRIRLARNVKDFFFPLRMTEKQNKDFLERLKSTNRKLKGYELVEMNKTDPLNRKLLCERHLISRDQVTEPANKGLLLKKDEKCSIMINEEDHFRIQVFQSGFDLNNTWDTAEKIEKEIGQDFEFAFSSTFGYLTACPTNVGTGIRASCMVHVPALVITKKMSRILEFIDKLSFTTRGLFGEGSQAVGNFFQVSNQVTLGSSEKEVIKNLEGIIKQLKQQETSARSYLMSSYKHSLQDKVWRALGSLKSARLISSDEALTHLSLLRLGTDLGIIGGLEKELINNLFVTTQPAHLQKIYKRQLSHTERDLIRGKLLGEKLKNIQI